MTDISYGALQGMRVDPDGRITYDFDGHIHAQGLDLDAPLNPPTGENEVRWLRTDTQALLAFLAAFRQAGLSQFEARAAASVDSTGNNDVEARLIAADADAAEHNAEVHAGIFKDIAQVHAIAAGGGLTLTRIIVDETGSSDFPQLVGTQKVLIDPLPATAFAAFSVGSLLLPTFTPALFPPNPTFVRVSGAVASQANSNDSLLTWAYDVPSLNPLQIRVRLGNPSLSAIAAGTWAGEVTAGY
jgi:hypothetical protein